VLLFAVCMPLLLMTGCGDPGTITVPPPPPPPPPPPSEVNSCKTVDTTSPAQPAPTSNVPGVGFTGVVKAGSTPVIGASVQVYAAGVTGNGSTPTALLSTALTTNASGEFSVPATFTCPLSNSVLYVVSKGGQAGSGGVSNAGLSLATVLGTCGSLKSGASFTINEETTVAAAFAMAQFFEGENLGATATNSSGIGLAAATFANLVNAAPGVAPGAELPATGTTEVTKINSLANALNSCAVGGPTSTECGQLYAAAYGTASSTSNTLGAIVSVAKSPGTNVAEVYAASGTSLAYVPALSAAPADWALRVSYTGGGMSDPAAVAIDSTGKVWVTNYNNVASLFTNTGSPVFAHGITGDKLEESYGGAVDVNDVMWIANEQSAGSVNNGGGSITLLNDAGASTGNYVTGGIYFPVFVAFDTSGVAWVVDYGNSSLTLLSANGTALSGTAGYSSANIGSPLAVATDAKCNAYVANEEKYTVTLVTADGSSYTDYTVGDEPSGIAIDASGNVWTANLQDNSVGLVSGGSVLSGSGFTGGGMDHPQGIAADGVGNVWVASNDAPGLTELAGAAATTPGVILSPSAGFGADSGMSKSLALAIDASGNVWVTNMGTNTLTEFVGIAAPVQTPLLGPVRVP
jgi:streptogramin lyase